MPKPYTVLLHLARSNDESVRSDRFNVELTDTDRSGTHARSRAGIAFLDLRAQLIPELGITMGELLETFLLGQRGTRA